MAEEKHYSDVSVVDFISLVEQMHTDSDIGFSQEFDVNILFYLFIAIRKGTIVDVSLM